jgi:hypothetical protein
MTSSRPAAATVAAAVVGAVVAVVVAWVLSADRPLLAVQQLVFPAQALLIGPTARVGYEVRPLPDDLQALLLEYLDKHRETRRRLKFSASSPEDYIIYGNTELVPLGTMQQRGVLMAMRPVLESFCGCQLNAAGVVHGIRIYRNGSKLVEHLDWPDTWVISASIHLRTIHHTAGGGGGGWPFVLRSGWEWWRGLKGTAVTHGEGEALLYEGSRLWHSRLEPLQADEYAALFVGFVPEHYPSEAPLSTRLVVGLVRAFREWAGL